MDPSREQHKGPEEEDEVGTGGPILDDDEATRMARRKLLKIAVYAAPVVVGVFTARAAEAATCEPNATCGPNEVCDPDCVPVACKPRQ